MDQLSYRRHRFPPPIIQHAIWLYLRFTLSYRDVEELLAERGLGGSYETVERWVLKFGPGFARRLRRSRPRPSNRWHLDEMVVRIAKRMYLWRAVDHEGEVLDMLVQRRRDTRAALRLMRKLLRKQGFAPKLLTTDKLGSYASAVSASSPDLPSSAGATGEQSRREFPPSRATARTQNAEVQVGCFCPALSQYARCRPQQFQPPAPSRLPIDPADLQSRGGSAMAKGRRSRVRSNSAPCPSKPTLVTVMEWMPPAPAPSASE